MLKQIATFVALTRLSSLVSQNLNGMAGFFQNYFAGTDNLRVISIILLLLAFILFLFLIVILYIKSLLSFIKESESNLSTTGSAGSGFSRTQTTDVELEKELEKELERDLEASRVKREILDDERKVESDKAKKQKEKKEKNTSLSRSSATEFDWKTGRKGELDELTAGITHFQVEPSMQPLETQIGLIINMLGRGIDAGKIAQTVKNKTRSLASEEEIIQTIDSIKSFISIANNNKFSALDDKELLPSPEDALLTLSYGKTGDALALMEALINTLVDKAAQTNMPQKRDLIFLEASNYACIFGSIALIEKDTELAQSAFELSVELSPKNANAWSRSGDANTLLKADSKAMLAYQNVLALADENLYPHQIANAKMHLADFYENQGDGKKASELRTESKRYYDLIGVNADLSSKEQDIITIIEQNQDQNMPTTVAKLLNLSIQKQKGRSYI